MNTGTILKYLSLIGGIAVGVAVLALWIAIAASWGLAFFEYCLAVPANRIGAKVYSLTQLKTLQEVMSLSGFLLVAWVMFGQKPGLPQLAGFGLIIAGAALIFKGD